MVVADSFEAGKEGGPEGKLSWADTKRFRLRMGCSGRAGHTDARHGPNSLITHGERFVLKRQRWEGTTGYRTG